MSTYIDKNGNTIICGGSVPKSKDITAVQKAFVPTNKSSGPSTIAKKIDAGVIKVPTVGAEIGKMISTARNSKGLKQVELAKLCNVTTSVISSYESGEALPDQKILSTLKRHLNIAKFPAIVKQKVAEEDIV